jgi:hypothetical protein
MKVLQILLIAASLGASAQIPVDGPVERIWYDGHRPRHVWMAPDQFAVIFDATNPPATPTAAEQMVRMAEPAARLLRKNGSVAYFRTAAAQRGGDRARTFRSRAGIRHSSPVFYESPDLAAGDPLALSGDIIVSFSVAVDPERFAADHGITLKRVIDFLPRTYLFDARSAPDSLTLANAIRREPGVDAAYPDWIRNVTRR